MHIAMTANTHVDDCYIGHIQSLPSKKSVLTEVPHHSLTTNNMTKFLHLRGKNVWWLKGGKQIPTKYSMAICSCTQTLHFYCNSLFSTLEHLVQSIGLLGNLAPKVQHNQTIHFSKHSTEVWACRNYSIDCHLTRPLLPPFTTGSKIVGIPEINSQRSA